MATQTSARRLTPKHIAIITVVGAVLVAVWLAWQVYRDGKAGSVEECDALTRQACLSTGRCTLVSALDEPSNDYICRPAANDCELRFRQDRAEADARENCSARAGCEYQGESCYCHCRGYGRTKRDDGWLETEGCLCDCSGGPPQICRRAQP